jgi:hypothetical protein
VPDPILRASVPGPAPATAILDAPLFPWFLGSILACVVATNLLWVIRSTARGKRWAGSPYGQILFYAGAFVYFLVVPYLVLGGWLPLAEDTTILGWQPQKGLLALADMGLVGLSEQWPVTRWLEAAGTGLGLGFLSLLALGLAWVNASGLSSIGRAADTAAGRASSGSRRLLSFAPQPWWMVLVSGLFLEVHWAFYRGAVAVIVDDVYAGVFLGLAAVCLEWVLNPFWRHGVAPPSGSASDAGRVWLNAGLALTSALIFLLARNLWICLAVHWLLALAFWLLARSPSATLQEGA